MLTSPEDQASQGASSSDARIKPTSQPQKIIEDSIDVRNKDLVNMWINILIIRDNSLTPVEDLVESTFREELFPGEDLASIRVHVSSQLSQNWELFDVRIEHGVKYVRLWKLIHQ